MKRAVISLAARGTIRDCAADGRYVFGLAESSAALVIQENTP